MDALDFQPRVSVLMPTFNGATYIEESIRSILRQTLSDFELIVVDDASTDSTREIVRSMASHDPRIRLVENPVNGGVVSARNIAFSHARAPFIAMLDHDDISLPNRLARQVELLERNEQTVLVCTDARRLKDGRIGERFSPGRFRYEDLRWRLYLNNPITQSTIMFRRRAVEAMGTFMRSGYEYADDFDFYHRILEMGRIEGIAESLTLYRLHERNASLQYNSEMAENASRVLANAYDKLLGDDAAWTARLISKLIGQKKPPASRDEIRQLNRALALLLEAYCRTYAVSDSDRRLLADDAHALFEEAVARGIGRGRVDLVPLARFGPMQGHRAPLGPSALRRGRALVAPLVPDRLRRPVEFSSKTSRNCHFHGRTFQPKELPRGMAPTLCVVVDTEAEFDWKAPFRRDQTAVDNIQEQWRAQTVFDRYGLRPVYAIDYPVATNREACRTLSRFVERGSCAIGAHLQPWTTPPFQEALTEQNSYPGNLPCELERMKLHGLKSAIAREFGLDPIYFKAGRYGLGPNTFSNLVAERFKVDLSIMPGADYRSTGGPDFREFDSVPYLASVDDAEILAVPMTRNFAGTLAYQGHLMEGRLALAGSALAPLHIRGLLARLRLFNSVPLTPEGVPAKESIQLIRSMFTRGYRLFVLHYHSSSLIPGFTPYAKDLAGRDQVLRRIEKILAYFFEIRGGMPGMPGDCLADWPVREPRPTDAAIAQPGGARA